MNNLGSHWRLNCIAPELLTLFFSCFSLCHVFLLMVEDEHDWAEADDGTCMEATRHERQRSPSRQKPGKEPDDMMVGSSDEDPLNAETSLNDLAALNAGGSDHDADLFELKDFFVSVFVWVGCMFSSSFLDGLCRVYWVDSAILCIR